MVAIITKGMFDSNLYHSSFHLKAPLIVKPNQQARQSHRRIRVVRVETDSQRIVGLLIPNAAVEAVLQGNYVTFPISINTPFPCCLSN